jgi:hypothetical protein
LCTGVRIIILAHWKEEGNKKDDKEVKAHVKTQNEGKQVLKRLKQMCRHSEWTYDKVL